MGKAFLQFAFITLTDVRVKSWRRKPFAHSLFLFSFVYLLSNGQAIGGFAGPGYVELDGENSYIWDRITLNEEDAGVLEVTGTFERDVDGDASLPSSTALFVYLELEDESFMRGEGTIDPSTGEFTATVMNVPEGFSKVFYSFVVLDPEETLVIDDDYAESVFYSDVISITCTSPLTTTLEWSTDNSDFDMEITEPDGSSWYAGDIGVSSCLAFRATFDAPGNFMKARTVLYGVILTDTWIGQLVLPCIFRVVVELRPKVIYW